VPVATTFKDEGCAPVKIWTTDVEAAALQQLHNMATLPFIHKHIAVMPDVHWGMGSTVGSVIPTIRAIVPASVGVDIGCGMVAAKLNIRPDQLPDNLHGVRTALEAAIPHGRTDNGAANDRGAWGDIPETVRGEWTRLSEDTRLTEVKEKHKKLFTQDSGARQLGTLGTGNHFVELCIDKENNLWVMLHSGSRGTGNRIGSYFIQKAKELMERFYVKLPDPDLAYIPEAEPIFGDYWKALSWAQDYALTNRTIMLHNAMSALSKELGLAVTYSAEAVNCHHNYVSRERHFGENVLVTRKGAVRVREGELGIIPGSMGARSFIVRGKGNADAFNSCSHGAGRKMSRGEAKRKFTLADMEAQTQGVECRKDADVIDEIPGAYKSIQEVMDNQSDLVDIVAELRQIVCVKG
jgi:tRNA-splicing ligase RtcB (3'-phosphate/5'-hydroxy nucleic acid ligase)